MNTLKFPEFSKSDKSLKHELWWIESSCGLVVEWHNIGLSHKRSPDRILLTAQFFVTLNVMNIIWGILHSFLLGSDLLLVFEWWTDFLHTLYSWKFPFTRNKRKSRVPCYLHGYHSLCYVINSKRNNAWNNKTHSISSRFSLIASNVILFQMLISEQLVKTLESRPDQITAKTSFWHEMTNNS